MEYKVRGHKSRMISKQVPKWDRAREKGAIYPYRRVVRRYRHSGIAVELKGQVLRDECSSQFPSGCQR